MRARLHVVAGVAKGRVVELTPERAIVLGRATDAGMSIAEDKALSRQHVRFELQPPRVIVTDLGSKHGMLVNGVKQQAAELRAHDHVQAGETVIRVELIDPASVAPTLAPTLAPGGAHAGHEAAPALPPGYEVVRLLGSGAMGSVYLAREPGGALRAVKQILPRVAMSAQMRAMFVRECSVQARLAHPNIVRVYEMAEPVAGNFSMIMEYVEGHSADTLLDGGRTVAPALAVAIACQALDGLAYAHASNIVHRDIKESNLMLVGDLAGAFQVKVADFGLAKNYQESGASGVTHDGALGGTLPYMSREQLLDFKYVKPPADIYALGATLYRLLTGRFPRDYADGDNWIVVSLERPIVPLRARMPGLPAALCAAVEKALEPEIAQRYASALEMRRALESLAL